MKCNDDASGAGLDTALAIIGIVAGVASMIYYNNAAAAEEQAYPDSPGYSGFGVIYVSLPSAIGGLVFGASAIYGWNARATCKRAKSWVATATRQ